MILQEPDHNQGTRAHTNALNMIVAVVLIDKKQKHGQQEIKMDK